MRIVIINGPNLNLLGKREPEIYGTCTMEQVLLDIQRTYPDIHLEYYQSNHEGDLIDWIQQFSFSPALPNTNPYIGLVINAGGYTHTSIALRDAISCATLPIIEVHISDITQRESFRNISLLTDVCKHSIIGHGTDGYKEAIKWIIKNCQ